MADAEHLKLLLDGTDAWNEWRRLNPGVRPDLSEARLSNAKLERVLLDGADLRGADLSKAQLSHASLHGANLDSSSLILADLLGAVLNEANLSGASFFGAFLFGTRMKSANLSGANLLGASLMGADLSSADLSSSHLTGANFHEANLSGARLLRCDLTAASLVGTRVQDASFEDCWVHGISVWNLQGNPRTQEHLIVTPRTELPVWVNDLEAAQFLSMLVYGRRSCFTSSASQVSRFVLLLGRFRDERKALPRELDRTLSAHGMVEVVLEPDRPTWRQAEKTFKVLLRAARLVVLDLTGLRNAAQLLEFLGSDPAGPPVLPITEVEDSAATDQLPSGERILPAVRFRGAQDLGESLSVRVFPQLGIVRE